MPKKPSAQSAGQSAGRLARSLRCLFRIWKNQARNRDEILEVLRLAETQSVINTDALNMLEGVLQVSDMRVGDIMVPRGSMTVIHRDDGVEQIRHAVLQSGHSRFPVIDTSKDDVEGIMFAKDVLRLTSDEDTGKAMRQYYRQPIFVPESKRLDVLLKEFRIKRHHLAIVVDEYGGVSGLVTIEDVLEQIVGEIDDEHDIDDEEMDIRKFGSERYTAKGRTSIEDFNEYFGKYSPPSLLDDNKFDTLGGLVTHEFGRVPRRGEKITVSDFQFEILRSDRRRIHLLRVRLPTLESE